MAQAKTVAVEVDNQTIQRPWDESDLVTDWSAFPNGYGILLNERLMFPEDLCLWRMKIDATRQLFVDDYLIAHQRDVKREYHSPQDHPANPLLTNAWPQYVGPDEEHGYRLYYNAGRYLHVAFSADGINWDKPNLDLVDHSAHPEHFAGGPNNAVAAGQIFGLFHDPEHSDADQRWRSILRGADCDETVTCPYRRTDDGKAVVARLHSLHTSPDGIRWSHRGEVAVPKSNGTFNAPYLRPIGVGDVLRVRWDPRLGTYVANTKHFLGPDMRMTPVHHTARVQAMCESNDLIHWSSPRIYAYPDGEDAKTSGMWGIYEADGFPYESMWLNYFSMTCYHPASREESRKRNLMPTRPYVKRNWIRLAASRDGRHFYYLGDRKPFVKQGPEGSWNCHYLRMANLHTVGGPLLKDDQLWFYYLGQNIDGPKSTWVQSAGVATLRRDGFASLNAEDEAGTVITRPLVFEGEGKLFLNADVSSGGSVRVSVVAEDGSEIDGFRTGDCRPVDKDATRSRVGWGRHESLASLKERYVRLAFHLKQAKMYSFWIE